MTAPRGSLDLLLLAALSSADEALHGYALIERLRAASGGYFDYPEGSIYPALHELERGGLVSSSWRTDGGRRRRLYALTERGGRELKTRAKAWDGYAAAVRTVLKGAL